MYNRYIPEHVNYTPVEPLKRRNEPEPMQSMGKNMPNGGSVESLLSMLAQGKKGLNQWLHGKADRGEHGIWEGWKDLGIDRGDILLVLILLLLMTQEEEGDLLLALGAVMFLNGEKKKQEDE